MTETDQAIELAAQNLWHWLRFAQANHPDSENVLWGLGYEKAPIRSEWLETVLTGIGMLSAQLDEAHAKLDQVRNWVDEPWSPEQGEDWDALTAILERLDDAR